MKREPRTTRDDFEYWLADMDDALERFSGRLPEPIRTKLDFTPSSLNVLEMWLLETYPSTKSMLEKDQTLNLDGIARYVGETFRKALGGKWDIRFDEPKDAYFGIPILIGFKNRYGVGMICPLLLATATADRRTGNFLRTLFENQTLRE